METIGILGSLSVPKGVRGSKILFLSEVLVVEESVPSNAKSEKEQSDHHYFTKYNMWLKVLTLYDNRHKNGCSWFMTR